MSKKNDPQVTATPEGPANRKGLHENTKKISQKRKAVKRGRGSAGMDQEQQKPNYWAVLPAAVRYDPELPDKAKLLYAEISSLTGQRGHCYASNEYFQRLFDISDRTVQRLLKALQARGLIQIQDGNGGAGRRKIYAGINPLAENPDNQQQEPRQKCRGNPDKNVGVHKNNKENNSSPSSPPGGERAKKALTKAEPDWKPDRFLGFWKFYPIHTSKQAAIRAWDRLKPSDELIAEIGKALRRQMATDLWTRGIGIPYPATYLNQRRWEDEIAKEAAPEPDREEGPEWI